MTFKIKTGYNLKLLTHKTMKLLGSFKNKITKEKNGKNVPYLEITEVIFDSNFDILRCALLIKILNL